jgi:hypothetical protein
MVKHTGKLQNLNKMGGGGGGGTTKKFLKANVSQDFSPVGFSPKRTLSYEHVFTLGCQRRHKHMCKQVCMMFNNLVCFTDPYVPLPPPPVSMEFLESILHSAFCMTSLKMVEGELNQYHPCYKSAPA